MGAIRDLRRERFAQFVAAGMAQEKAYIAAGYAEGGARGAASRLSSSVIVKTRICELLTETASLLQHKVLIDRDWVIGGLKKLAEDTTTSDSSRVRAYELCGKEIGMFREQHDHTMKWDGDLTKLSAAQLSRFLVYFEALADGRDPAGQVVDVQAQKVLQ